MKVLIIALLLCFVVCTFAGYRSYNNYIPSSYISRYAYANSHHYPSTYNHGYPVAYTYKAAENDKYYMYL